MPGDPSQMTERDIVPIESVEGRRTGSTGSDRLMVGLAALALIGGALTAVGNLLPEAPPEVSEVEPTATLRPSRTPRPTASPRPLREVAVEPGEPPPDVVAAESYTVTWVRANVDIVIRSQPQLDAAERGVLPAGTGALSDSAAETVPGWIQINEPAPGGWIPTRDGDVDLITRLEQRGLSGPEVSHLLAGANGFVATIWTPAGEPGGLSSTDGASWRALPDDEIGGWRSEGMAWGPAGWLTFSQDESDGSSWVWRSDDGLAWEPLGRMPGSTGYVQGIVGSEWGYLTYLDSGRGGPTSRFWLSTDGRHWLETGQIGLGSDAYPSVAASATGFYAWVANGEAPASTRRGAFLPGGERTWVPVTDGPDGPGTVVVGDGAGLLAVDMQPGSGATRVWRGSVQAGRVTWTRDELAEPVFAQHSVTGMAVHEGRAYAIGWEWDTDAAVVWTGAGGDWRRQKVDGIGGRAREIAAGPAGVAILAQQPSLLASNPVFWHLTDSGTFASERSPYVRPITEPAPADCPGLPGDVVELVATEASLAAACFGSAPITVRAWSQACDGCWGWPGMAEPEWLMAPGRNQFAPSPFESQDQYGWMQAVLRPPLQMSPEVAAGAWVQLTGHYDDPASADCRWRPDEDDQASYYESREQVVLNCRRIFVVTELTVVDGP